MQQAILEHLDFIDEDAGKIGAVNTLKIVDGKIYGYNTDGRGFTESLINAYGDLSGAKVAVIGSGGAARACVYALKKENATGNFRTSRFYRRRRGKDRCGQHFENCGR